MADALNTRKSDDEYLRSKKCACDMAEQTASLGDQHPFTVTGQ